MADRSVLLHGCGANQSVLPLLLPSYLPSQRASNEGLCTHGFLAGVWCGVYSCRALQLHTNIIHLGELGRRTQREVYQLPHICMGPCWNQYNARHTDYRHPNTRVDGSVNEYEKEGANHHDVQRRRIVSTLQALRACLILIHRC
jgi:hypothetical protein